MCVALYACGPFAACPAGPAEALACLSSGNWVRCVLFRTVRLDAGTGEVGKIRRIRDSLPVTMETFAVDKAFYDIGSADDLKELWDDADLDPVSNHYFFLIQHNSYHHPILCVF